jgi:hypothetical protein
MSKSNQVAAEHYAKKMWGEYYYQLHPDPAIIDCVGDCSVKDFLAGIDFANKWTLCSERMPFLEHRANRDGFYLVKCESSFPKNCKVVVAEYSPTSEMFYSESSEAAIKDAIAWRCI